MLKKLRGSGVGARALRGTAFTALQVVGSNGLRMLSNIILARLLFPEAFGLMSLAFMFIYGLQTFSDIGIKTSIIQNKNADEPDFLNTAWTLQVIRGVFLWLCACGLAIPAASIYNQDMLLVLLPVIGFGAVIDSFQTTLVAQENRHLRMARQTVLLLVAQAIGLVITVTLAFLLESVWSLAIGALVSSLLKQTILQIGMKGARNKFCWNHKYLLEVFHFGKYIFLATIATFLLNTSDRAILGLYLDIGMLGVYSIGILLGTAPSLLSNSIAGKILFPLYRMKSPSESEENRNKIFKARRLVSLMTICGSGFLAFIGPYLVNFIYDDRYILAGGMITLLSLRAVPGHTFIGDQNILLAHGDSERYFVFMMLKAISAIVFTLVGIQLYGLGGAIIAYGLANLITYPLRVVMINKYKGWDIKGESLLFSLGIIVNIAACAFHWEDVHKLFV